MPTRRAGEPTDPRAVPGAQRDTPTRLAMYRCMLVCRMFEEHAQALFFEGLVRGTTHLGIGKRPWRPGSRPSCAKTIGLSARIEATITRSPGVCQWHPCLPSCSGVRGA